MIRMIGSASDRLLALIVPKATAHAQTCWNEECSGTPSGCVWRRCCYSPGCGPGGSPVCCGSCIRVCG